jgi:hypothetical protein
MLRKIVSIVAGFILWALLWIVIGAVLRAVFPGNIHEDGSTESTVLLLVFVVLSVVFSILAGAMTVRIAATGSMEQALLLGIVLFAVGLLVEIAYWTVLPIWYHVLFLLLLVPAVLYGGWHQLEREARKRRGRGGLSRIPH